MSNYNAISRATFQGKLPSLSAKEIRQNDISERRKDRLLEIDEVRESTDSSGSKEESECQTPTLQFAPSVKKLRFYRNSTL